MNEDDPFQDAGRDLKQLSVKPPFIWPESRVHAELATYTDKPPTRKLFAEGDLISALLVGVADETIKWLEDLLLMDIHRRICLVMILFPAGPTREEHLRALDRLRASYSGGAKTLEIRLLPVDDYFDGDFKRMNLPPTVVQSHNTTTGRTLMSIGSVGDTGHDSVSVGSLNFVFHPDDAMRDVWRRWFQHVFSSAAPLTGNTLNIPHLVPAKGDREAARLWKAFVQGCQAVNYGAGAGPKVHPETGEILTDANGKDVVAWDEGKTALDPLGQVFQLVYASGWLVTVDEATRIKPLTIPVKATLLGQQAERTVGALTQKQSFTLQVLDDAVDKAIEKCRKVTDVMELLTYPLSQGNRWLPEDSKGLLEKELKSRNEHGQKALREALGGNDIKQFIANRAEKIRKDLNEMYSQLRQGDAVPDDKLKVVLDEVERRLTQALDSRITPRAIYNRIRAPDLTATAPDENWKQPLSLLMRSARILRESLTDLYFPRRFSGLSFSETDFRKACDVFGDVIVRKQEASRAKDELCKIDEIVKSEKRSKDKCQEIWQLVNDAQSVAEK